VASLEAIQTLLLAARHNVLLQAGRNDDGAVIKSLVVNPLMTLPPPFHELELLSRTSREASTPSVAHQ